MLWNNGHRQAESETNRQLKRCRSSRIKLYKGRGYPTLRRQPPQSDIDGV